MSHFVGFAGSAASGDVPPAAILAHRTAGAPDPGCHRPSFTRLNASPSRFWPHRPRGHPSRRDNRERLCCPRLAKYRGQNSKQWGNERYQEALQEVDECLWKAPQIRRADTFRVLSLVGLGRIDEAKAQLSQLMAEGRLVILPPRPPALASRMMASLQMAGWRPSLATDRKAI
jgi:hypothetical protein